MRKTVNWCVNYHNKEREFKGRFEKNNNQTEYSEEDRMNEPEVDQKEDEDPSPDAMPDCSLMC